MNIVIGYQLMVLDTTIIIDLISELLSLHNYDMSTERTWG